MKAGTAVVALALAGCGGGDEPGIDGTWAYRLSDTCFASLSFDTGKSEYISQVGCSLGGTDVGIDGEGGLTDFSRPGEVTLTPKNASCRTADHPVRVNTYKIKGSQLLFGSASGGIVFERVIDDGTYAPVSVRFGCWTMGQFTPSPIADL